MSGWIEKNEKIKQQIENKLVNLPQVFRDFYIDMQGDGKSMATIKNYINYVEHFMNYVTNNKNNPEFYLAVKPLIIKQYISNLSTRHSNGKVVKNSDDYQALRWSAINTFFSFLMFNDYIKENPMLKTKRPQIHTEHRTTFLTQDEITKVMESIDKNYTGHMRTRDRAIIGLALSTGLRVSALVQINLEDIDFDNNTVKVIEKRMKTRVIPFGNNTKALLQDWIADRNKYYGDVDTTALFLSQWKRRIGTNGVRDLTTKYTQCLNKHITPHKFRSSAATNLASAGVGVKIISNILGHESISTTMRYMGAISKEKDQAVNMLDNLCK